MVQLLEKVLSGDATPEEVKIVQEAPLSELLKAVQELGLSETQFLESLLDLE